MDLAEFAGGAGVYGVSDLFCSGDEEYHRSQCNFFAGDGTTLFGFGGALAVRGEGSVRGLVDTVDGVGRNGTCILGDYVGAKVGAKSFVG